MTFAKANSLFTTKSVTKEKTNQNLSDFIVQYSQGSVLGNKVTPVAASNIVAGAGQEIFVNNGSFGTDPLRNALGSSWVAASDSIAIANTNEQFTPAATIATHEIAAELSNASTPGSFNLSGS